MLKCTRPYQKCVFCGDHTWFVVSIRCHSVKTCDFWRSGVIPQGEMAFLFPVWDWNAAFIQEYAFVSSRRHHWQWWAIIFKPVIHLLWIGGTEWRGCPFVPLPVLGAISDSAAVWLFVYSQPPSSKSKVILLLLNCLMGGGKNYCRTWFHLIR